MTEKEQLEEDLNCLDKLLDFSKDHIANAQLEVDLNNTTTTTLDEVFSNINKYTKYNIPTAYSGNNKLYNLYVRKFLTKRAQQIFNNPKVIIYAQIPLKLQGTVFAFSPSKYRKAIKHLFDRAASHNIDTKSSSTTN